MGNRNNTKRSATERFLPTLAAKIGIIIETTKK